MKIPTIKQLGSFDAFRVWAVTRHDTIDCLLDRIVFRNAIREEFKKSDYANLPRCHRPSFRHFLPTESVSFPTQSDFLGDGLSDASIARLRGGAFQDDAKFIDQLSGLSPKEQERVLDHLDLGEAA